MIDRAFEQARKHEDNKKNIVKQRAIDRARDLLKAVGVVDPAVEQPFYIIPEGIGIRITRDIGGKPVERLKTEAKKVRIVTEYALDMMYSPKFSTLEEVTSQELIKLRVQDLGLTGTPTTKEVFERAMHSIIENMALELCRADVGPHQAIVDIEQPLSDVYYIAHEPIAIRDGNLCVFRLGCNAHGLWLHGIWARPDDGWYPEDQLVFALRNKA